MDARLLETIIEGNAAITVTVNAADLRSIIGEMMMRERRRISEAIERHKEQPSVTRKEAARMLNVSTETLRQWALSGYLTPVKIGVKVLYRMRDIEDILTAKGN